MTSYENPYQTTAPDPATRVRPTARHQLLPVAIALLVISILHITGGMFYFVFVYGQVTAPDADPQGTHATLVYCMYYGISIVYCLLLISGAFSMMRQGSYMWAVTVCILALIPMLGPCYIAAIPFGVWGLILLSRRDIRESFMRL